MAVGRWPFVVGSRLGQATENKRISKVISRFPRLSKNIENELRSMSNTTNNGRARTKSDYGLVWSLTVAGLVSGLLSSLLPMGLFLGVWLGVVVSAYLWLFRNLRSMWRVTGLTV